MNSLAEPILLARGGSIFPTSAGWIQYGMVPETIKDTMVLPDGVPSIFVVPARLFCATRGISLAELEFPIYYNFFIRNRCSKVVCMPEQRPVLERVLCEAVFGPQQLDPTEFSPAASGGLPDLLSEMEYFRRNPRRGGQRMELSDLVEFVEFDGNDRARLDRTVTIAHEAGGIAILENGVLRGRLRADPCEPIRQESLSKQPLRAFWAPLLGVSVLGSGHGFDPGNRTSGFIIWIEGRGVMVDPPVDSVDWLRGYDIPAKQIDTLILTHCHADHDAGTLQKILQGGRITIYTTPGVMASFVTKYSALTGMTPEAFRGLFDYHPVQVGKPVYLHGAEATFDYSLHSLPCAGFQIHLRGRSLVYPSDTLNQPERIQLLHEQGILSSARRDQLLHFPWHHTLVLHEAGIPPIHTPIEYLSTLEEEVKKRMLLVHVSEKSLPPGSDLKIAPTGLENTVDLGVAHLPVQEAVELLETMGRVEIFADLPVSRAAEFLRMVSREWFAPGEVVVEKGAPGHKFYMIVSGQAAVIKDQKEFKIYSGYDYFGETALILGQPRVADVVAKGPLEVLVLPREGFLHLLRGTNIADRLVHLARLRQLPSWELIVDSPVFRNLTSGQKTQVQNLLEPVAFDTLEPLGPEPILVEEGHVLVCLGPSIVDSLGRGGFAGDARAIQTGSPSRFCFKAGTAGKGFRFAIEPFKKFLDGNPGAFLQLSALTVPWEVAGEAAAKLPPQRLDPGD